MKVQIIYRNYKPLHAIHKSLVNCPPKNIEYVIPKVKSNLKFFYPLYSKYRQNLLVRKSIKILSKCFFNRPNDNSDFIHFVQYLPREIPDKKYVVDFEHFIGFFGFCAPSERDKKRLEFFLKEDNCIGVLPMSKAGLDTLIKEMPELYQDIKDKTKIVYPAMSYYESPSKKDYSIVKKNNKLKLLFVGNQVYRKGLHEVLEAFSRLDEDKFDLYVVSDIPGELKSRYIQKNIFYLEPKFSREDILNKVFDPCDIFVMPTHQDTFGMVYLDALSTGTPVIATKQFAIPEMVEDGVNGMLLETEKKYLDREFTKEEKEVIEEELTEKLSKTFVEFEYNRSKLEYMGKQAKRLFVEEGKFSIHKRNKQLSKIYKS
jgi:glycosyltransferase involved in cell wall biosynthesis